MIGLYALIFAGSVAGAAALVWVLCKLAPVLGLVDHPEGRKAHHGATPVVGGLAIMLGSALALLVVLAVMGRTEFLMGAVRHMYFIAGALILVVMGVVDDWRPIPAKYKLLIQAACCAGAVIGDKAIVGDVDLYINSHVLSLGPLVIPFSILVMLTITNALNMIDGVDGLAGGLAFVVLAVIAKALVTAGFNSAPFVIALGGALAGFLLFNFPLFPGQKAKAFLGDSGSLLFGFALGYMAIQLSALPGRVFKPSTALWFFFIPVADTIWIYLRRLWVARAPFAAGRDHIHHILMERFPPRTVTWLLVSASAVFAAAAYFAERRGVASNVVVVAWIGAFLLYGWVTHGSWKRAWDSSRKRDARALETVELPERASPTAREPGSSAVISGKAASSPLAD